MKPTTATTMFLACILSLTCCRAGDSEPEARAAARPDPPTSARALQRGVSWVGGRRVTRADLEPLTGHGVNWIVQTPFGWQRHHDDAEIRLATGNKYYWGESDEGLRVTHAFAKELGIETLLKPHIWITKPAPGKWRAEIAMNDEAAWRAWFANYERFILHYAALARDEGMAALCIGTELHATSVAREADWRALIAKVRAVYDGPLTYAANWYEEFEQIRFWDELDFIGIQGYFPISQDEHPGLDVLLAGWRPYLDKIEAVQRRYGKPVVFTEIGYRSAPDAAIRPWEWPKRPIPTASSACLATQARCYQAFFETFWERPWFAGAYFWKWFPDPRCRGNDCPRDFSPQGKPAETVLNLWYTGNRETALP